MLYEENDAPQQTDWFGGTMLLVLFVVVVGLTGGLLSSDANRNQGPVGVFQLSEKAGTPDCNERTDCPSPMVTAEDVANGYVRQLPPRQPIFEREL